MARLPSGDISVQRRAQQNHKQRSKRARATPFRPTVGSLIDVYVARNLKASADAVVARRHAWIGPFKVIAVPERVGSAASTDALESSTSRVTVSVPSAPDIAPFDVAIRFARPHNSEARCFKPPPDFDPDAPDAQPPATALPIDVYPKNIQTAKARQQQQQQQQQLQQLQPAADAAGEQSQQQQPPLQPASLDVASARSPSHPIRHVAPRHHLAADGVGMRGNAQAAQQTGAAAAPRPSLAASTTRRSPDEKRNCTGRASSA
ncbi:MAG: hypothetical protein H6835_19725 [Planctomycetes bacterium]|nr:hypothetical protein [Planctomycetota bacterium]